ncbi:E3 SUMO-protein ligase ZBED1-like [Haematobia irritans]|uniref:E3 SUMO-protein ligase ZBED1-like n=1 Tax=Haematobia irritans TaxID=7368 RepID=UPI003F502954
MSSRKKHSSIWLHFEDSGDGKAVCNYCKSKISITSGSNGNLSRHMKRKHPTTPLVLERQSFITHNSSSQNLSVANSNPTETINLNENNFMCEQPSSSAQASKAQPNITQFMRKPPTIRKVQQFDEQVLKMITKGHHAFRIVEEPEFKKLVSLISTCPGYSLPTRKTLSNNMLDNKYSTLMEEIKTNIQTASAVCLTTDGWTSLCHTSYIALTAHYIDESTKLKSHLLACLEFSDSHSSANISNFIKRVAEDFGITKKIAAIVTDNDANVVGAVRMGNWRWIGCYAHSLNLVVQTSLLQIDDVLKKVKRIVEFFHKSTTALKKLYDAQQQMGQ